MDLIRERLGIQQISRHDFKTPAQVVSHLCAIQAQDYYGSKWSLALRLSNCTDADINKAIDKRQIVRTWPMRGTLHFVAAPDVKWMQQLLAPRIISRSAARLRQLELDSKTITKSAGIISKSLQEHKQLTRNSIYELLEKKGIHTGDQRGIHILGQLSMQSLLCLGAHDDKQATYALLDEWVSKHHTYEGDTALAILAIRYFTGHGPATANDLSWWSGLTLTEVKKAINLAGNKLYSETINGTSYYVTDKRLVTPSGVEGQTKNNKPVTLSGSRLLSGEGQTSNEIHLLPGFDEYLLGYHDKNRSLVLDNEHVPKIIPGKNGMFMPMLIIKGRVAGTWKRTIKKDSVAIQIMPFGKLTKTQEAAVQKEIKRYGEFLGVENLTT